MDTCLRYVEKKTQDEISEVILPTKLGIPKIEVIKHTLNN